MLGLSSIPKDLLHTYTQVDPEGDGSTAHLAGWADWVATVTPKAKEPILSIGIHIWSAERPKPLRVPFCQCDLPWPGVVGTRTWRG